MVEWMTRAVTDMLDERIQTSMQLTKNICPSQLAYNHKLVHYTTHHTPIGARKQENELYSHTNKKLTTKHSKTYPENNLGENVMQ